MDSTVGFLGHVGTCAFTPFSVLSASLVSIHNGPWNDRCRKQEGPWLVVARAPASSHRSVWGVCQSPLDGCELSGYVLTSTVVPSNAVSDYLHPSTTGFFQKARLQSGCFLGARAPLRFFAARLKSNARTFWLCDRRLSFFPTSTSTLRDTQSRTPAAIHHLESQHHSRPQIFDSSGVDERCHNVGAEGCEQGGHQVVASLEDGTRDGRGSRTTTPNRLHRRRESRCSLSFRHYLRSR